jgi:hypothetical protein
VRRCTLDYSILLGAALCLSACDAGVDDRTGFES